MVKQWRSIKNINIILLSHLKGGVTGLFLTLSFKFLWKLMFYSKLVLRKWRYKFKTSAVQSYCSLDLLKVYTQVHVTQVSVHFFFLFPLFAELDSSPFWLCSRTHSLCSCSNSSFVSSPSRTNLELSEGSVALGSFRWFFDPRPLLSEGVSKTGSPTEVAVSREADWSSVARISLVMLRTPTWMVPSSSFWISRTRLASGNMSMKR